RFGVRSTPRDGRKSNDARRGARVRSKSKGVDDPGDHARARRLARRSADVVRGAGNARRRTAGTSVTSVTSVTADAREQVDILLVDDRAENLLALEAILEPLGQRLVRARSGEEALR